MARAAWLTPTAVSAMSWLLMVAAIGLSSATGAFICHPVCVGGAAGASSADRRRPSPLVPPRWTAKSAPVPLAAAKEDVADATITTPERTAKRRRSWEESYALLREYKDVHGHCNVPQAEKPLGTWVNTQRIEHARFLLHEEKRKKKEAGIDNGDEDEKMPASSMTAERKKLLDDVGFVWDAMSSTWNTRYDELCEFRKVNGHCVVPRSNGRLGAWVEKQRIEYKKYQAMHEESICDRDASPKSILTEERVKKLDAIGFVWDVREKQFQQKLGQLRIYKEMNRSIDPRYMSGSLALWVRKCEQQYRRYLDAVGAGLDEETVSGILPENRRIALENVGFCRSMFDEPRARSAGNRRSSWEERFEELEQYKAEHGNCLVPKNHGPLGSWVRAQRHLMKEEGTIGTSFENGGLLSQDRVDRLDRLGFIWDVHQWQWNQTYHELLQYKEEHNHTDVPMSYGGLGLWVFNQRKNYNSYRKGKQSGITPDRIELLKNIGFQFDLGQKILSEADERWQMRLNELEDYKKRHGSFSVKQSHNPSLYNWCQQQKAKLQGRKSPMKKEREDALRSIGFLEIVSE